MDNKKDDFYYLDKILTDLKFLIDHTSNKTKDDIVNDEVLVDSIMFRLIQISENSDKLTDSFKKTHSKLPWREIKGMRNRIVHDYGIVDMTIIYDTVSKDIPDMYKILKEFTIFKKTFKFRRKWGRQLIFMAVNVFNVYF